MASASSASLPAQLTDLMKSPETIQAPEPERLNSVATLGPEPSAGPNSRVARLPIELDIAVPVPNFKVRNLIALGKGQVVESRWGHGDDLPLAAGQVQLAWCEFEVIESRLAVRITRLA